MWRWCSWSMWFRWLGNVACYRFWLYGNANKEVLLALRLEFMLVSSLIKKPSLVLKIWDYSRMRISLASSRAHILAQTLGRHAFNFQLIWRPQIRAHTAKKRKLPEPIDSAKVKTVCPQKQQDLIGNAFCHCKWQETFRPSGTGKLISLKIKPTHTEKNEPKRDGFFFRGNDTISRAWKWDLGEAVGGRIPDSRRPASTGNWKNKKF